MNEVYSIYNRIVTEYQLDGDVIEEVASWGFVFLTVWGFSTLFYVTRCYLWNRNALAKDRDIAHSTQET